MPAISTLFAWRRLHAEFDKNYFIAKEQCADLYAEDIIEISDDCSNDWMEKQNENGECIGWQVNKECVARSRLRVDSRKWIAAKLKPGRYGEKTTQEITGGEGGPLQLVMKVVYE